MKLKKKKFKKLKVKFFLFLLVNLCICGSWLKNVQFSYLFEFSRNIYGFVTRFSVDEGFLRIETPLKTEANKEATV
jgi:hypothetical protein